MILSLAKKCVRGLGFLFLGVTGILITWILASILVVRLPQSPTSKSPADFGLSPQSTTSMGAQSIRITSDKLKAVVTWVIGTDVFFTNRHVATEICNTNGECEFEDFSVVSFSAAKRDLKKGVCLPNRDICTLHSVKKIPNYSNPRFASATIGETVYYINWEADDLQLIQGEIEEVRTGEIIVKGYARHGFSGSPIFNSAGQVLGVLANLEGNALLFFPHYYLFGWASAWKFKALTGGDLSWIKMNQADLDKREWKMDILQYMQGIPSGEKLCKSELRSFNFLVSFLWLQMNWKMRNGYENLDFNDFLLGVEESPSFQDTCRNLLRKIEMKPNKAKPNNH